MDRLVKPDINSIDLHFKRNQTSSSTFQLTNLMHTMSVAVSLTTTNPLIYTFNHPFSIIPPLSTSTYTLILSAPSDLPPLKSPGDVINVKSSMLPTGKASQQDLRIIFSKPGRHLFRDATIPISIVGSHVVDYLIFNHRNYLNLDMTSLFHGAIHGSTESELTNSLRFAVVSGNIDLVTGLIEHGCDLKKRDLNGRSIISSAVSAGNVDIVKVLISSGCETDEKIDKVLQEAASMNRVDLIEVLIKKLDINASDSLGRTPVHVAASYGHVEVIRYCVSVGGKTDESDVDGWTALHFAAEKGHSDVVKCLLEYSNFGKYALNKERKTAFTIAVENGRSDLYDLLYLEDALHCAATMMDVGELKGCLAEGAKVNGRDQNGWTALHRAAFKGRIESVEVLLSYGAEINVVDNVGFTPLHLAVEMGYVEVAVLLIARGANKTNLKFLKGKRINIGRGNKSPVQDFIDRDLVAICGSTNYENRS